MDCIVHGVTKSLTGLSYFLFHFIFSKVEINNTQVNQVKYFSKIFPLLSGQCHSRLFVTHFINTFTKVHTTGFQKWKMRLDVAEGKPKQKRIFYLGVW